MNRIIRMLLNSKNNTQHTWKAPLSIASIVLVATLTVGATNFQAHADEVVKKNPVALAAEKVSDASVEFMLKITDALLSGKVTPAEAAQKLISFEEGVVEKMEYLRGIQERIEHAVDSGELTREEADAKYGEYSKNKKANSGNERAQAYLKDVAGEIKAAIANGTMTSEEGKAKYAEAEARIEKRMAQKNAGNTRLEAYLAKVGAEIKEAVNNGEMTPEEGKAKYAETVEAIKQRMLHTPDKKPITKEEYDEAAAKMIKMVKAGEITREQMQARLDAMGSEMRESIRGEESKEISDDCMALRRRLGQAVRNGDMTREEAGRIWEEEGC